MTNIDKFLILVEYESGLIELFKIVAEHYRNQRHDSKVKLFAGLVNLELNLLRKPSVQYTSFQN